jgi:hypothetical protein
MKKLLRVGWIVLLVALCFTLTSSSTTAQQAKKEPPSPKKEAKAEEAKPAPQLMKWTSDADGVAKDGMFTRTAEPAFTFEYPSTFINDPLLGNEICRVKDPNGTPTVNVEVQKVAGDVKQLLNGFAQGYAKFLEERGIGTDVKIIYNKPLDPDVYGEEYPAQEFELEWKYQGQTLLTTYVNLIIKAGYYISMQGHVLGDIEKVKAIFETIDLEP